jgi:hypothetical protein
MLADPGLMETELIDMFEVLEIPLMTGKKVPLWGMGRHHEDSKLHRRAPSYEVGYSL